MIQQSGAFGLARPRPASPRIRRTLALAVLSVVAASSAQAQDLLTSWRDALANDALVASARSALEATRERVTQAQAVMRPAATGTAAVTRQDVDTNLAPSRMFTSRSFGVGLTMPLLRLQNLEQIEQSKLTAAIGEAQLEQAMQDLMIRVSQAYFDVLAAQDNLETIRAQKRAITEQLASARRNFEVGTATITDQQEAQARFDLNVAQELAAENDLAVKRSALSLLTGKPVPELNALGRGVTLAEPMPARESEWTGTAREHNLMVQQARLSTEISRREIERQRWGHAPTVDLVGNLSRTENSTLQLLGIKANTAAIGLQLNLPIYQGGGIDARVREAIATDSKVHADLESARRSAEQGARTAFLGVNSGLGQVRALEAAERSSQLALDSNLLGYQVGVRINIDVLNAQQQLFTTRRDLSKARYDVLVNGLRLKQTAGTLREEDLQAVNTLLSPAAQVQPPASGPAGATPRSPAAASVPVGSAGSPTPSPAPGTASPGNTTPRSTGVPAGSGPLRGRGGRVMKPVAPVNLAPAGPVTTPPATAPSSTPQPLTPSPGR